MRSVELTFLFLLTITLSWRIGNINALEGDSPRKEDSTLVDSTPEKEDQPAKEDPEEETPDSEQKPDDEPLARFDLSMKSPLDTCTYRGVILANNLKVLLIHDPTATKKFVSFSVGVGAFDDPKDLPGLINLLGSMLLLGSEDFPADLSNEAELPRLETAPETQTFSFEVDRGGDYYHYKLEAFANSMTEPLLDEASDSALEERIMQHSVNAELIRRFDKDPVAIHQIERMLSNENHPSSYFSQTNQEILKGYPGPIYKYGKGLLSEEVQALIVNKMRALFDKWYSADMMTLVVMGDDEFDAIENEIRASFGAIENKKAKKPEPADEDYVKNVGLLGRKIYIVPQNDINCLRLFFSTPDVLKQYKTAPVRYVSHLIQHEGRGSLISALRKRKLCEDLKTAYEAGGNLGFFHITCFLTETGLKAINSIIELIFQYVNMIKEIGVKRSIFDELEKIDRTEFIFKGNAVSPSLYVDDLSKALLKYPFEDVLSFTRLHPDWDEGVIRKFLSHLRPDNMNLTIVSKSFLEEATETEKFFETKYKITEIDEQDKLVWSKTEYSDEFQPPLDNEFIPENFILRPTSKDEPSDPQLIQDSHISHIWFKPNVSLKTPKLHVYLQFFSPMTRLDPSYRCHLEIFMKILNNSLNEELYPARVAGLEWSLQSTHYGIIAEVYGYDDKLPLLLERIMKKLTDYENELDLTEKLYLDTKKEFKDDLTIRGTKTKPPSDHGWDYLNFLLSESGWTDEDLLIILEPLVFEEMMDFLLDMMANLFIQGLIHGNCTDEKSEEIIRILEAPFESIYGLLPQQILPERVVKLNEKTHTAFLAVNTNPGVHAYYSYYQLNSKTVRDVVTSHLMTHVLEESCQKVLGDGKLQNCGELTLSGVQGFYLATTSEEKSSHDLDKVAEEFIKKIPETLNNLTEENFKALKEILIARRSEEPRHLKLLTQEYWFEIMNRTNYFGRRKDEVKELKTLQISDLLNFHKKYLDPSSNTRSKLAVHILPKADPPLPLTVPSGVAKIENITIFKSSLKLLPLPRSKIPTSTPGNKSKLRKPISTFEDEEDEKEGAEAEPTSSPRGEASTSKIKDTVVETQASTSGTTKERGSSSVAASSSG